MCTALSPEVRKRSTAGNLYGVVRQQVTAFMPSTVSERVDAVRVHWDPVMARRIQPHITLVHDAASIPGLHAQLDLVSDICEAFAVRLTSAQCWGRPADGIYLGVEDVEGGIETLRRTLGVIDPSDVQYVPHVTLTHPRTVAARSAHEAWADLATWRVDEIVMINAIAIIELGDAQWRTIAPVALATRT